LDIPRIFNITESAHRIHDPFTPEKLASLGAALRLERGTRVFSGDIIQLFEFFGDEQVILYASTAPLGDIDLDEAGALYGVKTRSKDIGIKTRGVQLVGGGTKNQPAGAEYREIKIELKTKK